MTLFWATGLSHVIELGRDGETEGEIESGTEGDWGRGAKSVAIRRGGEKRGQSVCNPGRSKPL